MKKISIVTSSQPSTNPRAIKEATALSAAGYEVSFIYTVTVSWAYELDKNIIDSYPKIKFVQAGKSLHLHPVYNRAVRIRRKLFEIGFNLGFKKICAKYCAVLLSQELYNKDKDIKSDLIIAHNIGALSVAARISKKTKILIGFDAEDFHRGEVSDNKSFHYKLTEYLENSYFSCLSYLTCSSPLISKEYKNLYPFLNITTVLNVFPLNYLHNTSDFERDSNSIKLFWFSQFIGPNRGIEDILIGMSKLLQYDFKLSLLGKLKPSDKLYFNTLMDSVSLPHNRVTFINPVNEIELVKIASQHDIGLATEMPYCKSRELCLTNKLFIYLMSGNAVLFSDTPAQQLFWSQYPGIGIVYESKNIESVVSKLEWVFKNKPEINKMKINSQLYAKDIFNWDKEKDKFLFVINCQFGNT